MSVRLTEKTVVTRILFPAALLFIDLGAGYTWR
jgi:hypothetical protein